MNWTDYVKTAFSGRTCPEADILEELAQHAQSAYEAARAEGATKEEALRRVDVQLTAWRDDAALLSRRPDRPTAVEPPAASGRGLGILQDLRYAARLLRRQPGHTALVVATMALGICATTILASVAYGVLLSPLPWKDADRFVKVYESREGSTNRFPPLATNFSYLAWRDAHTTVDALGAWSGSSMALTGVGDPERVRVASVTPSLLPMIGARPQIGRLFAEGEELPGRPPIVLLSHGLWQQRFGGQPDVIGKTVRLDSTTYTVVGVMPKDFRFLDRDARAWVPFHIRPPRQPGSKDVSVSLFNAIARLRPGVTPEQAAAEATARGRTVTPFEPIEMAIWGSNGPVIVSTVPLLEAMTKDVRPAILVLLAAVVLLLATATGNIASLQLARGTGRRREMAIRAAIGAGVGRLMRQSFVEHLLLGALGGIAGLIAAAAIGRALPALLPAEFPRIDNIGLNVRIELFALAVSMTAGLACGLGPALQARRLRLVPALVEDSLAPVGGSLRSGTARTRALIMAGQVAIACVLLVGAALLIRSFTHLINADVGYDPRNVLTARMSLPDDTYPPARRAQALAVLLDRLRATGGVQFAAASNVLAFTGTAALSSFPLETRDRGTVQVQTGARWVTPDYFSAVGQQIVQGRAFNARDTATSRPVVIVSEAFARKYLGPHPLEQTLPGDKAPRQIVGIVRDAARREVTDDPQPEMFRPWTQVELDDSDLNLIVRTAGDPRAIVPALRSIVRGEDPNLLVDSVMTLNDRISESLAQPRLYTILLAAFAAFALAIAGVGLFGVLSYSVAQRAREIGVRTALGATPFRVVTLVASQALIIVAAGLIAGVIAAAWLAGALQSLLYGVAPRDPVSFAAVAAVLLIVALVATIVPARRAASVDPVRVLR